MLARKEHSDDTVKGLGVASIGKPGTLSHLQYRYNKELGVLVLAGTAESASRKSRSEIPAELLSEISTISVEVLSGHLANYIDSANQEGKIAPAHPDFIHFVRQSIVGTNPLLVDSVLAAQVDGEASSAEGDRTRRHIAKFDDDKDADEPTFRAVRLSKRLPNITTNLEVVVFYEGGLHLAHRGQSQQYLIDRSPRKLTRDYSSSGLLNALDEMGDLLPKVDCRTVRFKAGNRLVLFTQGVFPTGHEVNLRKFLAPSKAPPEEHAKIIATALARYKPDDGYVLVVDPYYAEEPQKPVFGLGNLANLGATSDEASTTPAPASAKDAADVTTEAAVGKTSGPREDPRDGLSFGTGALAKDTDDRRLLDFSDAAGNEAIFEPPTVEGESAVVSHGDIGALQDQLVARFEEELAALEEEMVRRLHVKLEEIEQRLAKRRSQHPPSLSPAARSLVSETDDASQATAAVVAPEGLSSLGRARLAGARAARRFAHGSAGRRLVERWCVAERFAHQQWRVVETWFRAQPRRKRLIVAFAASGVLVLLVTLVFLLGKSCGEGSLAVGEQPLARAAADSQQGSGGGEAASTSKPESTHTYALGGAASKTENYVLARRLYREGDSGRTRVGGRLTKQQRITSLKNALLYFDRLIRLHEKDGTNDPDAWFMKARTEYVLAKLGVERSRYAAKALLSYGAYQKLVPKPPANKGKTLKRNIKSLRRWTR